VASQIEGLNREGVDPHRHRILWLNSLSMSTSANARDDGQKATIHVSGLQRVPEPCTLLLLGIGSGALLGTRRWRRFRAR
jgi:hypothetical protein